MQKLDLALYTDPDCTKAQHLEPIAFLPNLAKLKLASESRSGSAKAVYMLPESFSQLCKLRHLHTLNLNMPLQMSSLTSLHTVYLRFSHNATVDLSAFAHLSKLNIWAAFNAHSDIFLPVGDAVQLRSCQADTQRSIHNLRFATALTRLKLHPCQVQQIAWPTTLRNLRFLVFRDRDAEAQARHCLGLSQVMVHAEVHVPLPDAWQSYSQLESVRVPGLSQTALPKWLCSLQHLQCLELCRAMSQDFWGLLPLLTQLGSLDLREAPMIWSENIVQLAGLPCLMFLNLGWQGHYDADTGVCYPHYSQKKRTILTNLRMRLPLGQTH